MTQFLHQQHGSFCTCGSKYYYTGLFHVGFAEWKLHGPATTLLGAAMLVLKPWFGSSLFYKLLEW
jgi:hypothetical protein